MIDLDKVTPPPWSVDGIIGQTTKYVYADNCDGVIAIGLTPENAAFIALMSRVLEVQIRRGWWIEKTTDGWNLRNCRGRLAYYSHHASPEQWKSFMHPHPHPIHAYEALVAADEWLTQQESGK